MHRRRALAAAIAMVVGAFALGDVSIARAAVAKLPDMAMLAPFEFRLEINPQGRRLLRFTTIAVNIGGGPFELYGYDADGAEKGDTLSVRQRIKHDDGTWVERDTTAQMTWSGDGHEHWHVLDYQRFKLERLSGTTLGNVAKTGFCVFDSYRYTSNKPPRYTTDVDICQVGPTERVLMGQARKWGDVYRSTIAFQWIDITGIADGDYKVRVVIDPPFASGGRFLESNDSNNRSWTKIHLGANSVTILSRKADP